MFAIGGKTFSSRLLMGSSLYPNQQIMREALKASGTEIVTVALRRMDITASKNSLADVLLQDGYTLLPNTAGCYTAREAILTAHLAREALQTNWIKLEVIGDEHTLYPDSEELLQAASTLVQDGFVVLPYCSDDPVVCKKLEAAGCAAVMPLAAPIGSGAGICNPYNLQLIRSTVTVPVIVDAGIGTASDAALAMELGADAVLLNTAVAKALQPVAMATAMRLAVEAGHLASTAGRIPQKFFASPSTAMQGRLKIHG